MTARSVNDLAADRLTSFIATTLPSQAQADALADVRELRLAVARLEAAERYEAEEQRLAAEMRQERDDALELLQAAEVQVAALTQFADALLVVTGRRP